MLSWCFSAHIPQAKQKIPTSIFLTLSCSRVILRIFVQTIGWDIWDGTPAATEEFVCKLSESADPPLWAGVSVPLDPFLDFPGRWFGRISALCLCNFTHLCSVSPALSTAGYSLSAFGTGGFHFLADAQLLVLIPGNLCSKHCTPPQFPIYRVCTRIRGMVFTWEGL